MQKLVSTIIICGVAACCFGKKVKIEVRNAYDESLIEAIDVISSVPGENSKRQEVNRRSRVKVKYDEDMMVKADPLDERFFGRWFSVEDQSLFGVQKIYIYPTPAYERQLLKEKGCEVVDGLPESIESNDDEASDESYKEAVFTGGEEQMIDFLVSTIKYPEISMELGDEARVFIRFVVNKDGSLACAQTLRRGPRAIDVEALHTIRRMPNWEPAEKEGEIVRAYCRIPINFVLE